MNTSNNASFVGLRHPELVSGSEELNRQMLNQRSTPEGAKVKQVIRYAHRKSYLISCYRYGQDDGDRPLPLNFDTSYSRSVGGRSDRSADDSADCVYSLRR